MVSWTCHRCNKEMYSSWDWREEKVITCIYCGMIFENQYYRKEGRGADESKSNSKLCRQEPRF